MSRRAELLSLFLAALLALAPGPPARPAPAEPLPPPAFPDLGPMKNDFRLMRTLTLHLQRPTVREILGHVEDATGVELILSDNIDPNAEAFEYLKCENMACWSILQQLTLSEAVNGHWEVEDVDSRRSYVYRLRGNPARSTITGATATQAFWLSVGSALFVLAVTVAFFVYKVRSRRAAVLAETPRP